MRTLDKRVVGTLLAATVGLTSATVLSSPAGAAPPIRIHGVVTAAGGTGLPGIHVTALGERTVDGVAQWVEIDSGDDRGRRQLQRRQAARRQLQVRYDDPSGSYSTEFYNDEIRAEADATSSSCAVGGSTWRRSSWEARPTCPAWSPASTERGHRGSGGHGVRRAGRRLDPAHHHRDRRERALGPRPASGRGVQARLPRSRHRSRGVLERQRVPGRRRHPDRPGRRVDQRPERPARHAGAGAHPEPTPSRPRRPLPSPARRRRPTRPRPPRLRPPRRSRRLRPRRRRPRGS